MITWTVRTRWDLLPPRLSRPRRFTRSRLTRTAMPWPTSRTGCVSRPPRAGVQTATLRRVEGAQAAGANDSGQAIVERAPVSTGLEARVTDAGDYRFFAGRPSDPCCF